MTNLKTLADTATTQALEYVKAGQETATRSVQAWAESVQQLVPATPSLPSRDLFPKPAELVDGYFEFAEQLLTLQREFANSVLSAVTPAFQAAESAADRAAAATKSAAAKARNGAKA